MVRRSVLIGSAAAAGALLLRRQRSQRALTPDPSLSPATPVTSAGARSLVEAVLGRRPERRPLTIDFAPAVATDWELLIDGPSFFPRMLADIEAATSDVHILIFGFKSGEIGHKFRDLLIRKVAEGVAVRLSVEAGYSQPGLGEKVLYQALVKGGVQVVANQGAFLDLDGLLGERRIDWRFDDFLHFDHRKVIVIDGRVAFVGGPGIEDHYADDRFHDVMLRLEGPVVAQVQAVFLLSWHFQGGPLPDTAAGLDRFFPPAPEGEGLEIEMLMNNPGERHLPIAPAFREAVAGATRRLYVVNPYLADRGILRGIVDAAKRGVEVRVIVPADPHSMPASRAVRHWFGAHARRRRGPPGAPRDGAREGRPGRRHGARGDGEPRRAQPAPELGGPAADPRRRVRRPRRQGAVRPRRGGHDPRDRADEPSRSRAERAGVEGGAGPLIGTS